MVDSYCGIMQQLSCSSARPGGAGWRADVNERMAVETMKRQIRVTICMLLLFFVEFCGKSDALSERLLDFSDTHSLKQYVLESNGYELEPAEMDKIQIIDPEPEAFDSGTLKDELHLKIQYDDMEHMEVELTVAVKDGTIIDALGLDALVEEIIGIRNGRIGKEEAQEIALQKYAEKVRQAEEQNDSFYLACIERYGRDAVSPSDVVIKVLGFSTSNRWSVGVYSQTVNRAINSPSSPLYWYLWNIDATDGTVFDWDDGDPFRTLENVFTDEEIALMKAVVEKEQLSYQGAWMLTYHEDWPLEKLIGADSHEEIVWKGYKVEGLCEMKSGMSAAAVSTFKILRAHEDVYQWGRMHDEDGWAAIEKVLSLQSD